MRLAHLVAKPAIFPRTTKTKAEVAFRLRRQNDARWRAHAAGHLHDRRYWIDRVYLWLKFVP
jgi:hypothetical protein